MFDPVAVPGQGEEPSASLLLTEIASWVHSIPLQALVQRFGSGPRAFGRNTAADLPAELSELDEFTASAWDFRRSSGTDAADPRERNQVDADAVTGADEDLVLAAADALGLVRPRPPRYEHYDHVVMLGGLVRANLCRTAYAAYLLQHGVSADNVTAITAFRALAGNEKDAARDEFRLLEAFGLPRRDFEWEVMEDGLRRAFRLPAFTVERESAPGADEFARYKVASAQSAGRTVGLVVAPSLDPGRRANTGDGYRYWASEVAKLAAGQRVLAVTTCIYVPYQHAVALQHLSLPFGCSVDTVGIDFGVIDDSQGRQVFRAVHYLQEIRSAIRGYATLAGLLAGQGVAPETAR